MIVIEPGVLMILILTACTLGILVGVYVERSLLAPPRAALAKAKQQLAEAEASLAETRAKYGVTE